ncbi:MAG TPA: DoxX family protein [Puia sp.]|nr:DoxX family protein [Puia sp.]
MSTLQHVRQWSAAHHPRWLVILRIGLGLILLGKGINFMHDSTLLEELIYGNHDLTQNTTHWLPIVISWANMLGGFMILVGLWTRLMCLLQLPILIGAIIDINSQVGGFQSGNEWILAIVALILTIFFLVEGSGPLSLDGYFDRNRRSDTGTNMP